MKLVGADRLPEGGFLLVGNHRSDFDPITAMYALRDRGLTFVTKKENIDIPVGGRLIAGSGCISLDRSDDKQGLLVIRQAVRRGSVDAELAETMKRIAKDNMYKAVSNPEYARASYAAEMEQGALLEEAKRKL